LYAINWSGAFKSVQLTLFEQIISTSLGAHYSRVLRILRQKGFIEEKELTKMCLLPQKNIRSLVNKLVHDGLVTFQEMPIR